MDGKIRLEWSGVEWSGVESKVKWKGIVATRKGQKRKREKCSLFSQSLNLSLSLLGIIPEIAKKIK